MRKCLIAGMAALTFMMPSAYAGESVSDVISAAKSELAKAKKVGFEWRDTGKFLKQAEAALKDGNDKKAMKLAAKAKFQALASQQQAKDQANAGPRF